MRHFTNGKSPVGVSFLVNRSGNQKSGADHIFIKFPSKRENFLGGVAGVITVVIDAF